MLKTRANHKNWITRHRHSPLVQYGGAALAVWVGLSLWTLSSVLQRHPFALLLAAVLFTARFLGLGPAIFSSLASVACLYFFAYAALPRAALSASFQVERLLVFLAMALFASSMARQKTLAESRAERATREMAAIAEHSPDAIFTISPTGVITSWNQAAEQLFGYNEDEAMAIHASRLVPPERAEELARNRSTLLAGGRVQPYRTETLRKDGTRWPVLLSASPLFDSSGQVVGASAIVRDIAAEKQSEEAIRRSEKLAATGRLAASMAHEINNPLEAVLNLLYLARNDAARAPQYLTMAEQEVGRVARLAQQTLGFVRDSGAPALVDPAALMEEVLQLYSRKLDSRQIQIRRQYRDPGPVHAYAGELRQLFANLVVNAADAMPANGILAIRVSAAHDWPGNREGVRITVADNGTGIPAANLAHIFEPFFTTKQETGTGLGLWVSNGIVRKHGGWIRVRSRAVGNSTGTVFSVFLPYRDEMRQAA